MCFIPLCLGWESASPHRASFNFFWEWWDVGFRVTLYFFSRFWSVIWKKSLVLFIDPVQPGQANSLFTDWVWRSQGFCWGFSFPCIYTNITQETVFYPCRTNSDAKWLPTRSPAHLLSSAGCQLGRCHCGHPSVINLAHSCTHCQ